MEGILELSCSQYTDSAGSILLHRNDWKRFVAFIESGANAADVRTHCVGPGAYTSNTTVTAYIDIYSLGKKTINNMVQHLYPVWYFQLTMAGRSTKSDVFQLKHLRISYIPALAMFPPCFSWCRTSSNDISTTYRPREDFTHSSWLSGSQRKQAQNEVRSYPTSCCHSTSNHCSMQCCFWCIWTRLNGYCITTENKFLFVLFDDTFNPFHGPTCFTFKLVMHNTHSVFAWHRMTNFLSLGLSKDNDMMPTRKHKWHSPGSIKHSGS